MSFGNTGTDADGMRSGRDLPSYQNHLDYSYECARSSPPSYRSRRGSTPPTSTDEEIEAADVNALRQQIRFTKGESLRSTTGALRAAAEAKQTGHKALASLHGQGERLRGAGHMHGRRRVAPRTAFGGQSERSEAVNGGPFLATRFGNRLADTPRANRERAHYMVARDSGTGLQNANGRRGGYGRANSLYAFEEDGEDEMLERDINVNLGSLAVASGGLKNLAKTIHGVVREQNGELLGVGLRD
ncbi:hypothetical protein DRE_00446 [Drechslerella stenobrocha 248]|uniref:t-SNARE coiled-coil homology domain-containing protein n=1 Tax=Drechslerella stenobrocha 248 TaxID=1043628 RepID=W7I5N6_9PEZI|nr:hypothetical protein DRE_00446 [Drechslerella stenobrocha 248]